MQTGSLDPLVTARPYPSSQLGCVVSNSRASNGVVHVRSSGDRFFANAHACDILGRLANQATGGANSNSTTFVAYGSEFVDNTASIGGTEPGGIFVVGGQSGVQVNAASDNTV